MTRVLPWCREESHQSKVGAVGLNALRRRSGGKRCSQHPRLVPPSLLLCYRAEKSFPFSIFRGKIQVPNVPWMIHNQDFLKKKSSLFGPEDGP